MTDKSNIERQRNLILESIKKTGSQINLAKKLGVSRQSISRWIRGDSIMNGKYLFMLENIVNKKSHI